MKLFIFRVIGNTSRGDARKILASVGADEKESRFLYVGNLIAAFLFYLIRSEARIGHWNGLVFPVTGNGNWKEYLRMHTVGMECRRHGIRKRRSR